jgi:MFS family permease
MIALCFGATAINYIDRANLGVAAVAIQTELKIDPAIMGIILGGFFWTYALMQMPAGYLIDRFGPRPMYSIAVGWWSGRLSSDGVPWGKGGCAPLHTRLSPVSTFEAAKYDYNFIGTYGTGSTSIMVSSMLSRTL